MLLTAAQIAELRQIVQDHHTAFAINTYGPKTMPPAVVARLQELGLVSYTVNQAEESYMYGVLLQQLNNPQIASMNYPALKRYLAKNPVPLSNIEQQAVEIAASRGAQFVVGLGNRVAQDTGQVLVEADAALRQKLQNDIKTTVSQGIAQRESIKEIKSNMGHAMVDWTRDLDRIAATETSRAMNDGMAAQLRAEDGAQAEVAVLSRKGCCPECHAAYTGPDGAPLIFLLTDLEANGTNYKRNKVQRKAVVPPYHPNCACSLVAVSKYDGFDEDGDLVPMGKLGIRPHGTALKSLQASVNDLQKSDAKAMSWFGVRVANARPTSVDGCLRATIHSPSESYDGLIGPYHLAANAFVAHLPLRDVVLLGFNQLEDAGWALGQAAGPAEQVLASEWSTVPVHELANWSAGPKQAITLEQAQPKPPAVQKAQNPGDNRRRAVKDARLVFPARQAPQKPSVMDARQSLEVAAKQDGNPTLRLVEVPRRSPVAMPPHVQRITLSSQTLGLPPEKDEDQNEEIFQAARQNTRRRPVLDLGD